MSARIAVILILALTGLAACGDNKRLPASVAPVSLEGEANAAFQPITDIPIPEGARLDNERSLMLGGQDKWTGRLVLKIKESSADAFARYHQEMPLFGWSQITSVQAESSVLSFYQGNRIATIQIDGRTISGSSVSITLSPRYEADTMQTE